MRSHATPRGRWIGIAGIVVVVVGSLLNPVVSGAAPSLSERGVNITYYDYVTYPDSFIGSQSSSYADYIAGTLHANTVTVSFPLWTTSPRSSSVYAGTDPVAGNASTPSPVRLDILLKALTGRGLRVRLRPLINENALELARQAGTAQPRPVVCQLSGSDRSLRHAGRGGPPHLVRGGDRAAEPRRESAVELADQ